MSEGGETGRRAKGRPNVKTQGSTLGLPLKLFNWSVGEASWIPRVAVKCVGIRGNTSGEGGLLDDY